MEPTLTVEYDALDPRGEQPAVDRVALSRRPPTLAGLRVTIVLTMPPGSGVEDVAAEVADHLRAAAPEADLSTQRRDFMVDAPHERAELAADSDAAVIVVGPTATSAFVATVYGTHLEADGLPVVLVTPGAVRAVAEHAIRRGGAVLRICTNPDEVAEALTGNLTPDEQVSGTVAPAPVDPVACRGSLTTIHRHFHQAGWTDGLPIVPPTARALEEMLSGTSRPADDVVTPTMRPEGLPARVREAAIAAVMAGAVPAQLPIILAAAAALGDVEFESMTRSVNSFSFAYIVNGPIAEQAGLSGGLGALGPGHPANAAVGRALGLLTRTVGGAALGVTIAPTQGNPSSWAFAFAENESRSPWSPLHVDFGFDARESTVSLFTGGFSHLGNFYYEDVDGLVDAAASIDAITGVLLMVSAKRAAGLAAAGWTRESLEKHLWQRVTTPLGELRALPFFPLMKALIERPPTQRGPACWSPSYLTDPDDSVVPRFPRGGVRVVVVGVTSRPRRSSGP